jgi:class 3 adenylate cyclase
MKDPVERVVRALARRNAFAVLLGSFLLAHVVLASGLALLTLYLRIGERDFLILLAVLEAMVALDNLLSARIVSRMWEPVRAWQRGARDEEATIAAWRALATLPLEYVRRSRKYPLVYGYLPFIAFATWKLHLDWYDGLILAPAGLIVPVASQILRYFAMEIIVRPLLEEVAKGLPSDFALDAPGLPLRWRLLAVAPVINVITGVVVAGLTAHGHGGVKALGLSLLIAVGVAFTISIELVLLMSRSILRTIDDMQRATERVRSGDLEARVPVVATDETGALAQSFNSMVEGLDEREKLRSALGAFVDPALAERILQEGLDLEGEEVEATLLFLDVRNFTAFAERARPREVVALLDGLWEIVVPVLLRHGGHANKFIGDGLLGVFGTPDRHRDHADRAVAAATEIVALVRKRYRGRFGVGIGLNSGRVVTGTVGGGGRVDFTVIGDAVNTAARVETATRETGDDVLITEATRCLLIRDHGGFEERPAVPLKGKRESVRLWAPLAVAALADSAPPGAVTPASSGH